MNGTTALKLTGLIGGGIGLLTGVFLLFGDSWLGGVRTGNTEPWQEALYLFALLLGFIGITASALLLKGSLQTRYAQLTGGFAGVMAYFIYRLANLDFFWFLAGALFVAAGLVTVFSASFIRLPLPALKPSQKGGMNRELTPE